ncbi:carboxypeptidase-like regulatory domain-containing protein [Hymenobacter baengnokdamensis]|uniref:carboxypeptidase-like regulatory domain-containing protein n=1 Tax=Hymenobacter baengnokdamensis TaxID=2615203 RepID=UPI0017846598|nr:carboxypeptidase-like regulatory domain-containing protein [Hymenobacter baengnokdamensis]
MAQHATPIRIPQPCSESWDAMTPASGGRHCAACRKVVIDFTQKTDAEILAVLRQIAAGTTCGRLRADQLNRPLLPTVPASRWRTWLGAVLAAGSLLSASRATAQAATSYYSGGPTPALAPTGSSVSPAAGSTAAPVPAVPTIAPGGPVLLRGIITDFTTHEGLPGVTVLLKGTTTGTSTDASGHFALPLAAGTASARLTFSYVGYSSQEQLVIAENNQLLTVALKPDVHGLLGEVVVAGGIYYQRPWPWHPRRFFNWSKYWLTKSFRAG